MLNKPVSCDMASRTRYGERLDCQFKNGQERFQSNQQLQ